MRYQTPLFIWTTGRASSGKSTFTRVVRELCDNYDIPTLFFNDEQLLFQIKEEDVAHKHHYHPYGDERFLLRDNFNFDEGIRRITSALRELLYTGNRSYDLAVIELARGRRNPPFDVSFSRAFQIIGSDILEHSQFVYIKTFWEYQIERNITEDSDFSQRTPESVMVELYSSDDYEFIQPLYRDLFVEVENIGSIEDFRSKSIPLVQGILGKYKLIG